jgi:hypothetical protein
VGVETLSGRDTGDPRTRSLIAALRKSLKITKRVSQFFRVPALGMGFVRMAYALAILIRFDMMTII